MTNPVIGLDFPNPRIAVVSKEGLLFVPHILRLVTDIIRRLGGQRADHVREARVMALVGQAMMRAVTFGIATGYYHAPSEDEILSYAATSSTLATISVAQHTRSTAAATIQAGSVTGVTRGLVYYVYYADAGNAGGAVTFAATTDVSILTVAGRRTIGAIYIEPTPPTGGPG